MSVAGTALKSPGENARRDAQSGRGWYAVVARSGLVAKGLSFGLVGALAIALAVGSGGKATSREGALAQLAHHGFGKVMLGALALGFAAYALWRFVQAYAERPDEEDGKAKVWGRRLGYIGRGVIYGSLTFTTLKILFGSGGGGSQDERAHRSTAMVLDWPAGRWLIIAAGIVVVGAGLWNLYRGLARKFDDKWRAGRLSPAAQKWGTRAAVVGHVARFVVFGLIGVFLVKAARDYEPNQAIGIDGALQKLAHASYGPFLLGLTAAGLVAYGVYCLVDARLRDVSA